MKNIFLQIFLFPSTILLLIASGILGNRADNARAGTTSVNLDNTVSSYAGYVIYLPLLRTTNIQYSSPNTASRVNVPYYSDEIRSQTSAIFWFGEVNLYDNYADGRVGYSDEELFISISIFDRRLWYDKTPALTDLIEWDAVSVYLDTSGNVGLFPSTNSYRFVSQFNWWEDRGDWQLVYRGNGTTWDIVDVPITTESEWRGNAPNDEVDDKGWRMIFKIPFTSLGLSGPPQQGGVWGFGVRLYDRDDADGMLEISDKSWPAGFNENQPESWNELHFGLPTYSPPPIIQAGEILLKNDNEAGVIDAHVGGHTTCGEDGTLYFDRWGEMNYAGYEQINIQNQGDISDWPCSSKYYLTFPLNSLPSGKVVLSATLTMYQFGNSGQNWDPGPIPSLIQVLTIGSDWVENSITWNNAPLAIENVSQARVDPVPDAYVPWPGLPREWDVSLAVSVAYNRNEPLRVALYSADTAYHSGKYFYSSDAGEEAQPTLTIRWGNP